MIGKSKQWVANFLVAIAMASYRRPWLVLMGALSISAVLWWQIAALTFDVDEFAFVGYSKKQEQFDQFQYLYGSDAYSIVYLEPKDLFSIEFIRTLKNLHDELASRTPYLASVKSLVNVEDVAGDGHSLRVASLIKKVPGNLQELEVLERKIKATPRFKNFVVSKNFEGAILLVEMGDKYQEASDDDLLSELDTAVAPSSAETKGADVSVEQKRAAFVGGIREVVKKYRTADLQIRLVGPHVITNAYFQSINRNVPIFIAITIAVVMSLLFLLFRRTSGVLLPAVVVLMSLASTFGMMGLLGYPITLLSQVIPSFLLAVGVGDAVHILSRFYRSYDTGKDKKLCVEAAFEHSGLSILLTSLTTAFGLLSFCTADSPPLASLGIFAAFGVTLAFIYSITILPAAIAVLSLSPPKRSAESRTFLPKFLTRLTYVSYKYPYQVLAVFVVISGVAIGSLWQLRVSQNVADWFPDDSVYVQDLDYLGGVYSAVTSIEIVLDSGQKMGIADPDFLERVDSLITRFPEIITGTSVQLGQVISLLDVLKDTNKKLGDGASEHSLPVSRKVARQVLFLLEASLGEGLFNFTDRNLSTLRVSLRLSWADLNTVQELSRRLEKLAVDELKGEIDYYVTGSTPLISTILTIIMETMLSSYAVAGGVITIFLILILGSLSLGLLAMIANFAPIIFGLGFMGALGIPLDMSTISIASVCIGLVVDDTIHFFQSYSQEMAQSGNFEDSLDKTMQHIGRALIFSTLTLMAGFLVLVFANMKNLVWFGLVSSLIIFSALVIDLLVAPCLLVLRHRFRVKHRRLQPI